MSQRELFQKIRAAGQECVLRWWDELTATERAGLLDQLGQVNFEDLAGLADGVREGKFGKSPSGNNAMPDYVHLPQSLEEELARESARQCGERLIRQGKVAALVVAGGQGTRLGFDGPKGLFPIGPVSGKSLFQFHAERVLATRRRYDAVVPWYVMTSAANHAAICRFFEVQNHFGLPPQDVVFFQQGLMPALDRNFRLVLVAKDRILLSPNGHGGTLAALRDSGALDDMKARGIEEISYFQVDNPLIPAVDPVFLGFHWLAQAQMSSKSMWKRHSEEAVGAFVRISGRLGIMEYSELTSEQVHECNEQGLLKYGLGNPAAHAIRVEFVRQQTKPGSALPLHLAEKSSLRLNDEGKIAEADGKKVYKFERFIFDALRDADQSVILEIVREHEFSPVKNRTGSDSPDTAHADMSALYADWLDQAGLETPRDQAGRPIHPVEISPLYALDAPELVHRAPRGLNPDGPVYLAQDGG